MTLRRHAIAAMGFLNIGVGFGWLWELYKQPHNTIIALLALISFMVGLVGFVYLARSRKDDIRT